MCRFCEIFYLNHQDVKHAKIREKDVEAFYWGAPGVNPLQVS